MRRSSALAVLCGVLAMSAPAQGAPPAAAVDEFGDAKAREFVLTDIGNEPDDQMSLVRQLVYANEIDIEGIVATTSTWKRAIDEGSTSGWNQVIGGYEQVHANLVKHDRGYPTPARLRSIFSLGQRGYGMAELSKPLSEGARALIAAADRPDPRPLWITVWGGANTLARALHHVRTTRSAAELRAFVSKLRVYAISDQDDTGEWLRKEFPDLFYVVSPSQQCGGDCYARATWTGISGEHYYRQSTVARGPDPTTVTHAWLAAHVQSKGPLGAAYPNYLFIMEGDTPSWLWLIRNGLAGDRNPSWGGWGGRYVHRQPKGGPTTETRPIFTNGSCATGSDAGCTTDSRSADTVTGFDGQQHTEDFATVYRWRDAYQHDFANRMDWTIKDVDAANHAPDPIVNGSGGRAPVYLNVRPNTPVVLDARGSTDPDGDRLTFSWFHYAEAGRTLAASSPNVELSQPSGERITVTPKSTGQAHVILTATDDGGTAAGGPFPARTYRRVVLNVTDDAPAAPSGAPAQPGGPCTVVRGFRLISAHGRGRGVALQYARHADRPLTVDVFQQTRGRRVTGGTLVARYTTRSGRLIWNGRATRAGRSVTDGVYVVRARMRLADGSVDTRRIAVRRVRGTFRRLRAFDHPESCGAVRWFRAIGPAFGGRTARPLSLTYGVVAPTQVSVEVRRGSRVVKRFPARDARPGRTYRLALGAGRLRRGSYVVTLTARRGTEVVRRHVTAHRW